MGIESQDLANYSPSGKRAFAIKDGTLVWGALIDDLLNYGGSLATAASTIGSTKTVLTVSEPVTLAANLDLSTTGITLKFINNGVININSGVTLTMGPMEKVGNRQVFAGAGTVRYANGSVSCINLAWRAGNANNADVTTALNEAIASLNYAGGICSIYVPQLAPVTSGAHLCESAFHLFGNGNFSTGTNGRSNTLRIKSGATPAFMFKIGEGKACIRFANIVLDADGAANVDGILVEGAEGSGTTVADVSLQHVTLDSFRYGFNHNSTSGAHQLAQTIFDTVIFQGCTTAGLRTSSVNAGMTMINTNLAVPAGAIGWKNEGSGLVEWTGGEFAGGGSGTKVVVISAAHGAINFAPVQDENFGTFLENNASDSSGIINFGSGCLIQSKIQLNDTCKVNLLPGCNIMSYAIQGTATGAVVTVHEGCNIRTKSVNDGTTNVVPAVLLGVGSGVKVVTENLTDLGVFKQRIAQQFISPLSDLGNPSIPVLTLAHITNGTNEDKDLLWLGRMTTAGVREYGYALGRDHGTGRLYWFGNQTGFLGLDTNFDIKSQTPEPWTIPCSDTSSSLTTGTVKAYCRAPYAFKIISVRASVQTAPTGAPLIIDINRNGNSILSTKLSIDASEKTSVTAAVPAVIDTTELVNSIIVDDAEITIDIDQIGSIIAGKWLLVTIIGYRV
ncbi:MAG TPA: hypothetical protein VGC97_25580 [Pyrinomonadaceae bacterium]|jgi:hypothetical protein